MSNFQDVDVVLFRDSLSRPWGFRIQGGADFNFPLTIQRVFSGSPAEGELLRGDVILAFDGYDVGRLSHKQAQDVVRVAGGQIRIRVRRPVFGNPRPVTSSASMRPKSTSPRGDPAGTYFSSHEPPKPTWQPPKRGPGVPEFGVQYGPKTPGQYAVKRTTPTPTATPSHATSQNPYQDADQALQQMQDSLNKMERNDNQEDEVDYSFMKKSVSERKKAFQMDSMDARPRAASCQPHFRQNSYSSNLMTSSYTGPSYSSSPRNTNVMSSSYIEPSRSAQPPMHRSTSYGPSASNKTSSLPRRGFDFGWAPSQEKLLAARRAPQVSAVSQVQHSVSVHRDDQDDDQWMGSGYHPIIRSNSVSVLHESPTRNTITRNVESSAPRNFVQHPLADGSQFREVGRWHMETHSQAGPVKKFSTSATIRVGARGDPQPARVVRRFSASAAPVDGTMSLDRRHPEPLRITIGSTYNAAYHPAYPANVIGPSITSPKQRAAAREIQHHISRAQTHQSHAAPATSVVRPSAQRAGPKPRSVGSYKPLQQSYSTPATWDEPDYMSSDF